MTTTDLLLEDLRRTREWTLLLIADLDGDDWTYQPREGLQHPLWLCGHLACAQELLVFQRCCGQSRLDPAFMAHFPIGQPVAAATAAPWPPPAEVRAHMDAMQQATLECVARMTAADLERAAFGKDGAPHPHYATCAGAISHATRHEAFHAGQLATIRRLLGKPFLR